MIDGWQMSNHAVERALDMALEPAEIRNVLECPATTAPGGPKYPSNCRIWSRGRIALVVVPEDRAIVTCLWRGVVYTRGTDSEPFRDN